MEKEWEVLGENNLEENDFFPRPVMINRIASVFLWDGLGVSRK